MKILTAAQICDLDLDPYRDRGRTAWWVDHEWELKDRAKVWARGEVLTKLTYDLPAEDHYTGYVYMVEDEGFVVYVGSSFNLRQRMQHHRYAHPEWWDGRRRFWAWEAGRISEFFGACHWDFRTEEAILIALCHPSANQMVQLRMRARST